MAQAPKNSDQRRVTYIPISRHNRGDRDDMVRIGGVPHPEKKSQHQDGEKVNQVHRCNNQTSADIESPWTNTQGLRCVSPVPPSPLMRVLTIVSMSVCVAGTVTMAMAGMVALVQVVMHIGLRH